MLLRVNEMILHAGASASSAGDLVGVVIVGAAAEDGRGRGGRRRVLGQDGRLVRRKVRRVRLHRRRGRRRVMSAVDAAAAHPRVRRRGRREHGAAVQDARRQRVVNRAEVPVQLAQGRGVEPRTEHGLDLIIRALFLSGLTSSQCSARSARTPRRRACPCRRIRSRRIRVRRPGSRTGSS